MDLSRFWHSSLRQWCSLLLFAGGVVLVFRYTQQVKVELLPFTDSPPAWDGSFPYLVNSPVDMEAGVVRFRSRLMRIQPTVRHDSPVNEFEVDLHSGMFVLRQTDLFVADIMPLSLTRTYHSWELQTRAFGASTNHPYDICPTGTRNPYTYLDLNLEDGRQVHFRRISKGWSYADAVYRHDATSSEFYGAQIAWNGDGWTLSFRDGRRFIFPEAYAANSFAQGAAVEMRSADGHLLQLKRDSQRDLRQLISSSGKKISFEYDSLHRIVEASDDLGNVRKYTYASNGHLETVADALHVLYRFEYVSLVRAEGYDPYLMTAITDGNWRTLVRNTYNDGGMVSEQTLADGAVYRYEYVFAQKQGISETVVTLPSGEKKRFFFEHGISTKEE